MNIHTHSMEDQMERTITADMPIIEVVQKYPGTIQVFMQHGLGCIGCALARFENVREGAQAHGIDVEVLIKDLNESVPQA